jgi:uncharacterized protein (DUF2384 family)
MCERQRELHESQIAPRLTSKDLTLDLYAKYEQFIRRAVETLGSPAVARQWLDTPQEDFGGKTPLAYAQERNFDPEEFERYFIRLAHGIYA